MTHIFPRMRFSWILFLAFAVCLATFGRQQTLPTPKGITALMLHTYDFTTPVIDINGAVTSRKNGKATSYIERLDRSEGLEMTMIPAGTYWMGSTDEEARFWKAKANDSGDHVVELFNSEHPRHQVAVLGFYMGRYDVTIGQWKTVMGQMPEGMAWLPPIFQESTKQPIVQVSWDDAQEFCRRLSKLTGRQYRLPSEAEWEYAARAGTTTAFAYGETITPEVANYNADYSKDNRTFGPEGGKTSVAGSLGVANAFGLYDMVGNVDQWCQDRGHVNYNGAPTDGSAWESGNDDNGRVMRGGSWSDGAWKCRSASRRAFETDFKTRANGFRVVVSVRTPLSAK